MVAGLAHRKKCSAGLEIPLYTLYDLPIENVRQQREDAARMI